MANDGRRKYGGDPLTPLRQLGLAARNVGGLPAYHLRLASARRRLPPVQTLSYGPARRQYCLLVEPDGSHPTDDLPWAFYFHGGAWTLGSPELFASAALPWLAAGFRVVLPSYRRPPAVRLPEIVGDCRTALAEVAALARATGRPLDTGAQVAGISAGGHLAALLALRPNWWTAAGWPDPPRRALLCAAPLDFNLLRPRRLFRRYPDLDPIQLVKEDSTIRFLLLHGNRDGMVDYHHSLRFTERAAHARLITIAGGGHLAAGRWTYDGSDPVAEELSSFIRSSASAGSV